MLFKLIRISCAVICIASRSRFQVCANRSRLENSCTSRSVRHLSGERSLRKLCANRARVCIQLRKALRSLFGGERSLWRLFATGSAVCNQSYESFRGPFASIRRFAADDRGPFPSPSNPTNAVQLSHSGVRLIRHLVGCCCVGGDADLNSVDRILRGPLSILKLHSVASCFGRREEPMPFGGFRLVSAAALIVGCSVEVCASCSRRLRGVGKMQFWR